MAFYPNMNSPFPKNEFAQWLVLAVTITAAIFTVAAMRHQIQLNKMQIDELKERKISNFKNNSNPI